MPLDKLSAVAAVGELTAYVLHRSHRFFRKLSVIALRVKDSMWELTKMGHVKAGYLSSMVWYAHSSISR